MAGKQAKVITPGMLRRMLGYVRKSRYPRRNRVIVLLGVKAGLRACEIAGLECRWCSTVRAASAGR
jgi:integrase